MKSIFIIVTLLSLYCLTTSLQCNKCSTKALRLDKTKSWIPLKGKTQLTFADNAGVLTNFKIKAIDTIETATNDCGESFQYEYINTSLYLNQSVTDSIYFSLSSGGWLCMRAVSGNNPNIAMCNVFGQTKEEVIAKRFNNFSVGNKNYQELIVLFHNPGYSDNIDSVFIANNVGIVGFKYLNRRYALQ